MFGKIFEKLILKTVSGKNKEEMLEHVMENFIGEMTSEERNDIAQKMISHFLDDLDLNTLLPHVSQMMMPKILSLILPNLDSETKNQFILKMIEVLLTQGCCDLSKDDRNILKTKIDKFLVDKDIDLENS